MFKKIFIASIALLVLTGCSFSFGGKNDNRGSNDNNDNNRVAICTGGDMTFELEEINGKLRYMTAEMELDLEKEYRMTFDDDQMTEIKNELRKAFDDYDSLQLTNVSSYGQVVVMEMRIDLQGRDLDSITNELGMPTFASQNYTFDKAVRELESDGKTYCSY